jgi:hypothetical protein
MQARVFLRQSLFSAPPGPSASGAPSDAAGHVPANAAILVGDLTEQTAFGVTITVSGWADERGRTLTGPARTLIVPAAKIDHIWIEGT